MAQMTQRFAQDMLVHCVRKERPPLTIWETEQLLRAWLQLDAARAVAAEQAEEDALWCIPESIEEAFFQQELRRLAAAIEGPNTGGER